MRWLALVVVLALGAQAAEPARPADAPVILEAGQPAPSRGLWKPEAKAIRDEAHTSAVEAENTELRKSAAAAWWVPVLVGLVALGAGVAIGAAGSASAREAGK